MLQRSTFFWSPFFLILLLGSGCQTQTSNEQGHSKSNLPVAPLFEKSFSEYSKHLRITVQSNDGHFRGAQLGMTQEEIRGIEKAQFEELNIDTLDNEWMRFSSDFDLNSNVDFEYHFGKTNSLNKILASIYFDNLSKRDSVFEEFINFYTDEWGLPVSKTAIMSRWQPSKFYILEIQTEGGNLQPTMVIGITQP